MIIFAPMKPPILGVVEKRIIFLSSGSRAFVPAYSVAVPETSIIITFRGEELECARFNPDKVLSTRLFHFRYCTNCAIMIEWSLSLSSHCVHSPRKNR